MQSTCKALIRDRKNSHLQGLYCKQNKCYKRTIRANKRYFRRVQICELEASCKENIKLFWSKLRDLSSNENNQNNGLDNVNPDEWYDFFSNLCNPSTNYDSFDDAFTLSVKNG